MARLAAMQDLWLWAPGVFYFLPWNSTVQPTTAVLSFAVMPRLAAVWICLWKSKTLFHFGPVSSDILKPTKAIITDREAGFMGQAWLSWRCKWVDWGLPGLVEVTTMLINTEWVEIGKQRRGQVYKQPSTALTSTAQNICQLFLWLHLQAMFH